MIELNMEVFLWGFIIIYGFAGLGSVITGIVKYGTPKGNGVWDFGDIITGILFLIWIGLTILL